MSRRSPQSSPHGDNPLLNAAIFLWKRDLPVPADLVFRLLEQGFDTDALETRYRP